MVSISLVKSQLRSTKVRRQIGSNGIRKISSNYGDGAVSQKGFLGRVWRQIQGLSNWLSNRLTESGGLRNINFTRIWDWAVSSFNTLWSFNWNQTDANINRTIDNLWQQLTVRMSGIAGRAFGYLVCGAAPATTIAVVNKPLAVFLLKELGEEAITDLSNEMNAFLQEAGRATLNAGALTAFRNVRKWIKKATKNPKYRGLVSGFINPEIIDNWGEEEGKEWSFQSEFQRKIEQLPEPWQDRVEEFTDEFSDACIEAGYVIAGGLDEWVGINAATRNDFSPLGQERTIEFYPDRDVKSEKFILRGREQFLKSQIVDIVNQKQLLDNREITLSLPSEEWGRIPVTENGAIEVEFEFYKFEQPPYWDKERRGKNGRQRIHLYNIDKTSLTFEKLKKAWNQAAFTNGDILTVVTWTNGRKSQIWASTESEGEKVAQTLQQFTKEKIVFPIIFSTPKGSPPGKSSIEIKKNHRQYLAFIKIWNWDRITKYERTLGKSEPTDRKRLIKRLAVHYDQEPSWWKVDLQEVLRTTV